MTFAKVKSGHSFETSFIIFKTNLFNCTLLSKSEITTTTTTTTYQSTNSTVFVLLFIMYFSGIPYASPPIGKLRFMPPVTSDHWKGVKQADSFGPACPQVLPDISNMTEALKRMTLGRYHMVKSMISRLQNQSEDCLYLNIYSPANGK